MHRRRYPAPLTLLTIPLLPLLAALFVALIVVPSPARAQSKGQPGHFDFYLLDMPWGPEFCSIAGVSPQCKPQRSFVLHGLWAQNNDGSYPVFCSKEAGPLHPEANLDITPDLQLLHHEWAKHGACSAVGPTRFFAMEHAAFHSIHTPPLFAHVDHHLTMSPSHILALFYQANPHLPKGSLLVSCHDNRLTAVEACFTKSLQPMRCLGLHSCTQPEIKVASSNPN